MCQIVPLLNTMFKIMTRANCQIKIDLDSKYKSRLIKTDKNVRNRKYNVLQINDHVDLAEA